MMVAGFLEVVLCLCSARDRRDIAHRFLTFCHICLRLCIQCSDCCKLTFLTTGASCRRGGGVGIVCVCLLVGRDVKPTNASLAPVKIVKFTDECAEFDRTSGV